MIPPVRELEHAMILGDKVVIKGKQCSRPVQGARTLGDICCASCQGGSYRSKYDLFV